MIYDTQLAKRGQKWTPLSHQVTVTTKTILGLFVLTKFHKYFHAELKFVNENLNLYKYFYKSDKFDLHK